MELVSEFTQNKKTFYCGSSLLCVSLDRFLLILFNVSYCLVNSVFLLFSSSDCDLVSHFLQIQ